MSHYRHLSIFERESIQELRLQGYSLAAIGKEIKRSKSTISREIKRNSRANHRGYRPYSAQLKYERRRQKCKREKILNDPNKKEVVLRLIEQQQWSPEEISQRLLMENKFSVSYATIYRAINCGLMEQPGVYRDNGKYSLEKKLRRKGKKIKRKDEKRGKILISHRITERPEKANERAEIGHLEIDTVFGTKGTSCMVTSVDRRTRFLIAQRCEELSKQSVCDTLVKMLNPYVGTKLLSITCDRGKEFGNHPKVSEQLNGIQFYFADPHSPWQRGTNENTNGLLREYMPKRTSFDTYSDEQISSFIHKLNCRPRKCLNWKTPYEAFFDTVLHLT